MKNSNKNTLYNIYGTWSQLPFKQFELKIVEMQVRILDAMKKKNIKEVMMLQRILVGTLAARIIAVLKVTETNGGKTPGVDGTIWITDEDKFTAAESLKEATPAKYKATPLRRVMIPKAGKPGETRPLGIPTIKDRAVQALYLLALEPIAELSADSTSFGFREGLGTMDAIAILNRKLWTSPYTKGIYEGDIKGFFNNINHEWILDNILLPKPILKEFIRAGFLYKGEWNPTEIGVPQGGVISPMIANMTLDGMTNAIIKEFEEQKKKIPVGISLIRYADDFIILAKETSKSHWIWSKVILIALEKFLRVRGLELHSTKSKLTNFRQKHFVFLGVTFKLVTNVAGQLRLITFPDRLKKVIFIARVQELLKENIEMSTGEMIERLNWMLRGWGEYYKFTNAAETFRDVDHAIWVIFLRWLKRKYPKVSSKILISRHFKLSVKNTLTPVGVVLMNNKKKDISLYRLSNVKLFRYSTIRLATTLQQKLNRMRKGK